MSEAKTYHDEGDWEEDPVAAMIISNPNRVVGRIYLGYLGLPYNNWGSLWIVCTGICAIFFD